MIDRKELLQIELSPFSEWVQCMYYAYEAPCIFSVRYLYMVMFCRYYEALSRKYHWNIEIETFRTILTAEMIRDEHEGCCDSFFELYNVGKSLLLEVGKRFGWTIADIFIDLDRNEVFDEWKNECISLTAFLDTYDQITTDEKRIFLAYKEVFDEIVGLEGECEVCVMENPKLGQYLAYRESHMEEIESMFKEEDERIIYLVDWVGHPLFMQFARNQKREGNNFYAAFICGFNGEFEIDIYYLLPEWVIGCFVIYELLLHAEQLFQYQVAE